MKVKEEEDKIEEATGEKIDLTELEKLVDSEENKNEQTDKSGNDSIGSTQPTNSSVEKRTENSSSNNEQLH